MKRTNLNLTEEFKLLAQQMEKLAIAFALFANDCEIQAHQLKREIEYNKLNHKKVEISYFESC